MTGESPEQWLAREVGELLDAGSVGLYELVWLLNGSKFELNEAEKRAIAYAVARRIVDAGEAQVFELSWPGGEVVGGPVELATRISSSEAWPVEAAERYLALRA